MQQYPEPEKLAHPGLTQGLLKTLEMAMEGDEKYGWYNGLLFTVRNLTAEQAGKSLGPGRSTIAAHADHVRLCLAYACHTLRGEPFPVDWGKSWEIRSVGEAEWEEIKAGLEQEYRALHRLMAEKPFWRESDLSTAINNIAHTAYHAGAVRQILKG